MLQFWRKPEKKNKAYSENGNCVPQTSSINKSAFNEPYLKQECKQESKVDQIQEFEDEGLDIDEIVARKEKSRLSKTLKETLGSDKSALCYFIQYMEAKNASPYIMCWLDIDTFKSDMLSSLENNSMVGCNNNSSPVPNSRTEHDSLSVSTDCDSFTADSNSLFDYSSSLSCADNAQNTPSLCKSDQNNCCDKTSDNNNEFCIITGVKRINLTDNSNDNNKNTLVDNALMIFKKYVALEATCSVRCPEELRKQIMENICTSTLSPSCFDSLQNFVFDIMETEFFDAFLCSDFYCKYQIDVLTSGNIVLDDILYNETALFYFMEFLEQENCSHLLEFWIAANNFQQQLNDQKEFFDPVEAQNDAVVLYDKYFSLQAHCPLGFGDKVRFNVEQNICGENGLIMDCFHLPLRIIERVLEKKYLKSFLSSQLFYKYLSELISSVETVNSNAVIEKQTRAESDCSSERSFSTNTFLALEIDQQQNLKRRDNVNRSTTDMNIDTRELYDPDALWKRRKSHRLSCGRVTELGKFETDFEPEPDRKQFKLKNVVKKFVSLDEENRKKEELAWQVAEMIVKDITNVTLNGHK